MLPLRDFEMLLRYSFRFSSRLSFSFRLSSCLSSSSSCKVLRQISEHLLHIFSRQAHALNQTLQLLLICKRPLLWRIVDSLTEINGLVIVYRSDFVFSKIIHVPIGLAVLNVVQPSLRNVQPLFF